MKNQQRETFEETGIDVRGKLVFILKTRSTSYDEITKLVNNVFRNVYVFIFKNKLSNLVAEGQKGLGFEAYSINEIENLSEEQKKKFIPRIISQEYIDLYKKIIQKINER